MNALLKISLLSILTLSSLTVLSQDKPELSFTSTEVAPGLYMLMGVGGFTGGNIGLSVGEDGVVMIDDSMPPMLDMMKAAIANITKKPVSFLINTHVHGDHTGNNEAMGKSGTHIVAHENLRSHLLKKGVKSQEKMIPAPKAALPVITFSDEMNFYLNGNNTHIFHVANAHTDGDAVIHFKDLNVIHTGDTFFNGMFPYIDLTSGGSVDGYIAAQKKILSKANNNTKIIAGHGPLGNKASLQASVNMLTDSKKLITNLLLQGKTEEQIVQLNPLANYHDKWNWSFITTEKMTRQMVKGLSSTSMMSKVKTHKHSGNSHTHSAKSHSH